MKHKKYMCLVTVVTIDGPNDEYQYLFDRFPSIDDIDTVVRRDLGFSVEDNANVDWWYVQIVGIEE